VSPENRGGRHFGVPNPDPLSATDSTFALFSLVFPASFRLQDLHYQYYTLRIGSLEKKSKKGH
jgi:hypothetical protein